jgi:16S rRNA (adenine1518-N6/adenine1519-N6)-dimethyltransferase
MVKAKKSFGQNFLQDQSVVKKIIKAAEIKKGETVLEIGPGTGVLTRALVNAGAKVIAVEADHDLIAPLEEEFGDVITLIEGDILSIWGQVGIREFFEKIPVSRPDPKQYKLIANIPYNITSDIIQHFLRADKKPKQIVLMVQKEVADRIIAKPSKMSLLSVVCQLYAKCSKIANVPAGAFRPIPKVDSAIVKLDLVHGSAVDIEQVIKLAKVGFSSKRKQLHKILLQRKLKVVKTLKKHFKNLILIRVFVLKHFPFKIGLI